DVAAGKEREVAISRQPSRITYLAFSSDGKSLATLAQYGSFRLWDVATGKEQPLFPATGGNQAVAALAPDGKSVAVTSNYEIKIWDTATRQERLTLRVSRPQSNFAALA